VIFVDTDSDLEVGALVVVDLHGERQRCIVVVGTSQVIHAGVAPAARLVGEVGAPPEDELDIEETLDRHPASSMPAISEMVTVHGRQGVVTNLDVPNRRVTVRVDDGTYTTVGAEELGR
jgi:hypothetical protein